MQPDDKQRLQDMLQYAMEALEHANGKDRADIHHNRLLELSLTRLVEIIGEAASKVSLECQAHNPEIPWPDIIGMRHRLAHGYDVVDVDVLWDTICDDLPALIKILQAVLEKLEHSK